MMTRRDAIKAMALLPAVAGGMPMVQRLSLSRTASGIMRDNRTEMFAAFIRATLSPEQITRLRRDYRTGLATLTPAGNNSRAE